MSSLVNMVQLFNSLAGFIGEGSMAGPELACPEDCELPGVPDEAQSAGIPGERDILHLAVYRGRRQGFGKGRWSADVAAEPIGAVAVVAGWRRPEVG